MAGWRFLTKHALVIIHLYLHPRSTLREIAAGAGITERSVTTIIKQMERAGLVSHVKAGRSNSYSVDVDAVLRSQTGGGYTHRELLDGVYRLLSHSDDGGRAGDRRSGEPAEADASGGDEESDGDDAA